MESKEKKLISQFNDEVNYTDLIDSGRQEANKDNFQLAMHYINLALLAPNLDKNFKIQALAIKSFIHYKKKNKNMPLSLSYKIFKFLNNEKIELMETTILFCSVRMLYRGGSIMVENNFPYIGAYCFYFAKKLFDYRALRGETDSLETLEKAIKNVLNTISKDVSFCFHFIFILFSFYFHFYFHFIFIFIFILKTIHKFFSKNRSISENKNL